MVLTPSDHQGLALKQKLDYEKRKEIFGNNYPLKRKSLKKGTKIHLKERDFEEKEREKIRLLIEKKELQQKLSYLPKKKSNQFEAAQTRSECTKGKG